MFSDLTPPEFPLDIPELSCVKITAEGVCVVSQEDLDLVDRIMRQDALNRGRDDVKHDLLIKEADRCLKR